MLIKFAVANYLSFKEAGELRMVASSERIHPHHVLRAPSRNHPNLLRATAIYGANAAGKSNLVKALKFMRNLVINGTKLEAKIAVQRFRLNSACLQQPSNFEIEFRVGNTNYAYHFSVDAEQIWAEELRTITNSSDTLLYSRQTSPKGEVSVDFGPFFSRLKEKDRQILEFIVEGTRPNQLLLHETIERNVKWFRPVYDWFRKTLKIIEPNTESRSLEIRVGIDEEFRSFFANILETAGTGISAIQVEETGPEALVGLPAELIADASQELAEHKYMLVRGSNGCRLVITKRDDELRMRKLTTVHTGNEQGSNIAFEVHEESDGTQRLFDLVPMLYELAIGDGECVYVVDEIGRSMHPHLINMIMAMHLDPANANKANQLIITTHETNLLDLDILRRDEIWFAEKREDGSTDLYSLSDFQPRYDKDIRRDYLVGRYGGIPFIGNTQQLRLPSLNPKIEVNQVEEVDVTPTF